MVQDGIMPGTVVSQHPIVTREQKAKVLLCR